MSSEYRYSVGTGNLVIGEVDIPKEVQFDPVYLMNMLVNQITDNLKQQDKIVKHADQFFVD